MLVEKGVVEVGFCADRVQGSAVEGTDLINELIAEVGAFLVLPVVVEIDLEATVSAFTNTLCQDGLDHTCTSTPK